MAQIEIPEYWRNIVCSILETEDLNLIEWTQGSRQRYETDFTYYDPKADPPWQTAWHWEVYQPLRDFLKLDHVTGCLVTMKTPAGETYEFFFRFRGEKTYGKILLRPNHNSIVLFSAHRPTREKLSCE